MPNITEDLDEVRAAFDQRLASSEVLAQWWQEQVVASGADQQIEELVREDIRQQLSELSDYKRPRKIEVRFDEFEKTTTQKTTGKRQQQQHQQCRQVIK